MKREGAEVKVFRVPKEENHKVDLLAKMAILGMVEMVANILVKMAEAPCTESIMVETIKEREDWRTLIL